MILAKNMQSLPYWLSHASGDQHLVVALRGFPVELADPPRLYQTDITVNKSMKQLLKLCKGSIYYMSVPFSNLHDVPRANCAMC